MLKKEFLELLDKKLSLINESEREDILLEYGTYIDDKMAGGVSEEEAVAGFGDVNELAKEILDAYKINTDTMDKFSNKADKTIDKVYQKMEDSIYKLGNFSMNEIFHIIFDAIVLLFVLWIGKIIIVDFLCYCFLTLLFNLFVGFFDITDFLMVLIRILYLCLALYFFAKVMSKRINRYRAHTQNVGVIDDIKETWNDNIKSNDLPPVPNRPLYHERKNKGLDPTFLKILLILVMIPVSILFIASGIALVVLIYVSMTYATSSIGLYCMAIAFLLGSLMVLLMFMKAWPKKEETHA